MRKLRVSRKSKGICLFCKRPAVEGMSLCEEHRKTNMLRARQRREVRRAAGLCERCTKKAVPGPDRLKTSLCLDCYLKVLARQQFGSAKRWQELKTIFGRQPICPYTGILMELGATASLDHKVPKARGGTHESANLQFVYSSGAFDVNRMKGEMTDIEFRAAIKKISNYLQ